MIDCLEYRRQIGADPEHLDAAASAHRETCQACSSYTDRQLALSAKLRIALSVPLPDVDGSPYTITEPNESAVDEANGATRQYAWIGIAASLTLGLGLALTAWHWGPQGSIGHDLVAHVLHEEATLVSTDKAVPVKSLNAVLRDTGASMSEDQLVSYARTCVFRGRRVPHLVVQGESGPVTVMILPDVSVDAPSEFSESGYFGTLLPTESGSIAVISGETSDIEPVASSISDALSWDI